MALTEASAGKARGDPWLALGLVAFALVAASARAPHLVDYDSAQFALALEQHDLRLHQPQPPGYILTVTLARLVRRLTGDALEALHVVAVLFLAGAAVATYALARRAYDRTTARWAAAFFLTSPVVFFHALTTAVYPADAFAGATVAWLALGVRDRRSLMAVAFAAGLAGSLRPTATVFALPLVVHAVWRSRARGRDAAAAAAALAAGLALWFVPQLGVAAGLSSYIEANRDLQAHILAQSPWRSGWGAARVHAHRAVTVLLFGAGAVRLALLLAARTRAAASRAQAGGVTPGFVAAWVAAPLVFLLAYHFPKSGYALALWPALCLGLARLVARARRRTLAAALAVDLGVFFLVPTMHVCCRADWEIEEAAAHPPGTLVRWAWVPSAWMQRTAWPPPLQRAGRALLGRVDFFYDRTRDFDFGGVLHQLRAAGLPRSDLLMIGHHATRAACYALPRQRSVHADMNRPDPFVLYAGRRGTVIGDSLAVPADIAWLLVEGPAEQLRLDWPPDARSARLPPPLDKRFTLVAVGGGPVRARFRPVGTPDSDRPQLTLVRGAAPHR